MGGLDVLVRIIYFSTIIDSRIEKPTSTIIDTEARLVPLLFVLSLALAPLPRSGRVGMSLHHIF